MEMNQLMEALEGVSTKQAERVEAAKTELEAKNSELALALESKGAELTELAERMQDLESKAAAAKARGEKATVNLGQSVVDSAEFKDAAATRQARKVEVKAAQSPVTTANTTLATQLAGVAALPQLRPTVYNALSKINVSTGVADFIREISFENATDEVPETNAKPLSKAEFDHVSIPLPTVAHYIKVSEQMLADAPAVASLINARMGAKLLEKVDSLVVEGLQLPNQSTPVTGASGDGIYAAVRKAIAALDTDGFTATAIVLHPNDAAKLDLDVLSTGDFRATDARAYNAPVMWGLPVIKSAAATEGQFIVLDGSFVNIIERQGATVELGFDADDFTKNLRTIRAEMRMGLAVYNKAAVRTGAVTTP